MLQYTKDTRGYKISYLLMADTIERLDTIILELRHLQRNIIHSMREPGFSAPLRFEEDFLWGTGWEQHFRDFLLKDDDKIIDKNILLFGNPKHTFSLKMDDVDKETFYKAFYKIFHEIVAVYEKTKGKELISNKDASMLSALFNDAKNLLEEVKKKEKFNNIKQVNDILKILDDSSLKKVKDVIAKLIQMNLNNLLAHLWEKTEWRISYGRHYNNLRGTQLLKRLIIRDKFKFCRFALNHAGITAGAHSEDMMNPDALARFIILRNAVHTRCNQYLERIMEYQSLFNKVLDIGVREFPMPSTERRREIGIYMDFLNNRVTCLHDETAHLVEHLKIFTSDQENDDQKNEPDPIILHSWKHHFTAEHQFQEDSVGLNLSEEGHDENICNLHHITTSYWMPERMDLQPIIAHEIAHLIIHEHFDNLSDAFFQNTQASSFSGLQRGLFRVLRQYDQRLGMGKLSPAHKPRFLLREISCDLLAASVKGFSYLYALLLESIGVGLDKYLLYGNLESDTDLSNLIDLDMVYSLEGTGGHPATMRRDWWLRLKLIIFWLKQVHHWKPSGLDLILLEGTDSLLDNLLAFFDRITLLPDDRKGEIWKALFERLCDEIETSGAVIEVRKWRRDRSYSAVDRHRAPDNSFLRFTWPIPQELRTALKEIQMGMKLKPGKGLSGEDQNSHEIENKFNSTYLINSPFEYQEKDGVVYSEHTHHRGENKKDIDWIGSDLYDHLYDIPWKCAITRSIDLFGNCDYSGSVDLKQFQKNTWLDYYKNSPQEKTLDMLHQDNALGRELYTLALEFYMFMSEQAVDRVVHVCHLIITHKKTREELEEIIGKEIVEEWKEELQKVLKNRTKIKVNKEAEDLLKKILNEIEQLSNRKEYLPLINYLTMHKKEDGSYKCGEILNEILNAMASGHTPDNKKECHLYDTGIEAIRCFRMILVSRYTVGGFYAMQPDITKYNAFTDFNFCPVRLLKGETYWIKDELQNPDDKKCVYPFKKIQYCNVLGRYDAMSFIRTRPLCRCPLPYFRNKKKEYSYKFASLLARRAFGIRVDLNSEKQCIEHINRHKGFGLVGSVSVVLKRRSLRIPFLARLLASAQKKDTGGIIHEQELIGQYLQQDKDSVLLLDGSVDFLILICHDDKDVARDKLLERVDHVIDLAYWLYQDFMVERTEIIFDAFVLDKIVKEIISDPESDYSLECAIRFFDDQFLNYSMVDFKSNLVKRIKKFNSEEDKNSSLFVLIELTPGRMDLLLTFFNTKMEELGKTKNAIIWEFEMRKGKDFRDNLVKLLEEEGEGGNLPGSFIDRIEINVNKKA
jgi:hypothetical protein